MARRKALAKQTDDELQTSKLDLEAEIKSIDDEVDRRKRVAAAQEKMDAVLSEFAVDVSDLIPKPVRKPKPAAKKAAKK